MSSPILPPGRYIKSLTYSNFVPARIKLWSIVRTHTVYNNKAIHRNTETQRNVVCREQATQCITNNKVVRPHLPQLQPLQLPVEPTEHLSIHNQ